MKPCSVRLPTNEVATLSGELGGIPATYKEVNFPFFIGYEIENNMIISHWMLADHMVLMEQLS